MTFNPSLIAKIISSVDQISERDVEIKSKSSIVQGKWLDPIQVEPIVSYLLRPYEHGYWSFGGEWMSSAPIFLYLLDELGTLRELENIPESKVPGFLARQLSVAKRMELIHVTSRLSALHFLFLAAKRDAEGDDLSVIHDRYSWIKRINLSRFREKFSSAYEIFESLVYYPGYKAGVGENNRLIIGANGLVNYSSYPSNGGKILLASAEKKSIEGLHAFYEASGVIQNSSIERIFSPEERLFYPYFDFLSGVFSYVIQDERAQNFSQALDYYRAEDFTHCISTLGLVAEDYLTRIYVTLLREQCLPGMTLGQLNEAIHKRIIEILQPAKDVLLNLDELYSRVNGLADNGAEVKDQKSIYRGLLNVIKEDRIFFNKRIDELTKNSPRISPFPCRVRDNIFELLRFRNAASHNTRVPLGEFEAVRTLYCLVSLVSWWQQCIVDTDWEKGREQIIAQVVENGKR